MATVTEIREILMILATNYPYWERDMGEDKMRAAFKLYEHFLSDLPAEVLQAAAYAHIAESRFFPTIAELREQALDIMEPDEQTALEAWHDPNSRLARRIKDRLPEYTDRMITLKEQAVIKSQFIKEYNAIVARERRNRRRLPEIQALRQRLLEDPRREEEPCLKLVK